VSGRAPVSSVYYDYQPGPAKYTTPGGVIQGILEKKWQFLIRGGVLQSMFDTSLTIGDEILQQVLGKGTDKQMHNIVATIQQEQNSKTEIVQQTMHWLNKHLHEKIKLDDLADTLNFNKYYISRVFKNMTGFSINEYLIECRLNRAKYLLEMEENKSIQEIAVMCGFEYNTYFTRLFRQRLGLPPIAGISTSRSFG
jgi:YesN/AraC family two-component response regulator